MKFSQLFSQTMRDIPSETDAASHQLLLRAGFIRQLASGVFSYLPLGLRVLKNIQTIIRQEIDAIGGVEILMPVIQPADLWKETGRWHSIDSEMGRFKDRSNRDMVLAMTHEEVIGDLVRKEIHSYRQLPQLLYHIQTKWRDDPRPRAGLIRVREFLMKDSYTLDADWDGLDKQYRAHYQAYFNIYRRCGLDAIAVNADVGMMGGQLAHEFMYLTPIGEDTILICTSCGYKANRQIAKFRKPTPVKEPEKVLEKIETPDCKTIEDLAIFLKIPTSQTAKAVFMIADIPNKAEKSHFIFAIVRGDMEVNETKLTNALQARSLRPATDEEIRSIGAVPGYASPIGLVSQHTLFEIVIIVDDLIPHSKNLVSGANEIGYHYLNVNYGRDYTAHTSLDITAAQDGDQCPECGQPMKSYRGVEVGNIFKLGTRYSDSLGCTFLDEEGAKKPVIMGSYGIGLGRLLACIAEDNHDQQGLIWPITVAPFQVHLILLGGKKKSPSPGPAEKGPTEQAAETIYAELIENKISVLFDDRSESPGVKFKDADLIGVPIRLTVSDRSISNGGIEVKRRDRQEREVIAANKVLNWVMTEISDMNAAIQKTLITEEFS